MFLKTVINLLNKVLELVVLAINQSVHIVHKFRMVSKQCGDFLLNGLLER